MAIASIGSRRMVETKMKAEKVVSSMLKNTETHFELVDLYKYNKTDRLQSKLYQQYFFLCYRNTKNSGLACMLLCIEPGM